MPVQVLHGIRSNANSLRAIVPPAVPPRRVHWLWRHNFRLLLLLLGQLLCSSVSLNSALSSLAISCQISIEHEAPQKTTSKLMSSMDSALVRQCLHWAMPVGALLAALPSGHLCARLGARQFLFWAALLSSTAALFVRIGIGAIQILCATLFLQGVAYAAVMASIGLLCVQWAPLDGYSLFLSAASAGFPIASHWPERLTGLSCSTSPLSALPILAVAIACAQVLFALLWLSLGSDQPRSCDQVTPKELDCIQREKAAEHAAMVDGLPGSREEMPALAMLTDCTLWVCWLNAAAGLGSFSFLLTQSWSQLLPAEVDSADAAVVGAWRPLPSSVLRSIFLVIHLLPIVMAPAVGMASDRIHANSWLISERQKMVLFNCLAVGLPGLAFLGLALVRLFPSPLPAALPPPWLRPSVAAGLLGLLCAPISLSVAPACFLKCAMLASRQHGHHFVLQIGAGLALAVNAGLHSMDKHLAAAKYFGGRQKAILMLCWAGFCLVANLLFFLVATDQPANFADYGKNKKERDAEEASSSCCSSRRPPRSRGSCVQFSIGGE